jgi:hypothetical protein
MSGDEGPGLAGATAHPERLLARTPPASCSGRAGDPGRGRPHARLAAAIQS